LKCFLIGRHLTLLKSRHPGNGILGPVVRGMQQGFFYDRETMIKLSAITDKMDQYQHETLMWARSLDFFKQENNYLKNRLSEVVDKTSDKYFLAQAEHFQNQFIIKDEFIDELKHDVNEQLRQLKSQTVRISSQMADMEEKYSEHQDNLREQMIYLEKDFTTLRNEFQDYLNRRPWA